MELKSKNAELCWAWLSLRIDPMPEPRPLNHLTWQYNTGQLYRLYMLEVSTAGGGILSVNEFWEIMQVIYPKVTIVGNPGDRVFKNLRLRHYMSKEDQDRAKREASLVAAWNKKWEDRKRAGDDTLESS